MKPEKKEGFIPPHGGYENLISYKKSEIIFDGTKYFTNRFYPKYDRTIDQMVQAARSCKQNIAEASGASAVSKETEIKLTNVARASLLELRDDYKDFIRNNGLRFWTMDHRLMKRFREINRTPNANYETFRKGIENPDPEICANIMLCLIHITTYLLAKQIQKLEKDFLNEGGLRERMLKARLEHIKNQKNNPEQNQKKNPDDIEKEI